ncbi:MAG TPA: hypothetical protein VLG40_05210 [Candidatus Saccharimonas sp.]|nr:hypothetical protein [Candidatus Saccharimonas sp.]
MPGRTRRADNLIDAGMGPDRLTRASQAEGLGEIGVDGRAREIALKLLAPPRHNARIALAHKAAEDWALSAMGTDVFALHAICLVAALDKAGIGGKCNVTGAATQRHPAFAQCGSGRKHARDGGAWDAAIEPLLAGADFLPANDHHILVVVGGIAAAFPVGNRLVPAEWARSFAMQQLMKSLHSPSLAAGWAGVVNLADKLFDANIGFDSCKVVPVYTHQEWVQKLLTELWARPESSTRRRRPRRPQRGTLGVA